MWLDHRLMLNAAAFFEQVDDYQYFYVDALTASQIIGNIDKVDVRGFELETQYRLLPGWDLFANLGINDTEIKELDAFPQYEGNKAPKNTDWTGVLGTQYRGAIGSGGLSWFGRVDVQFAGKKYWQIDNDDVQDRRLPERARRSRGRTLGRLRLGQEPDRRTGVLGVRAARVLGARRRHRVSHAARTYGVDFNYRF